MGHKLDEVVEFATNAGQVGDVAVAKSMPFGTVLGQWTSATS